jgi:hypothetical protein
MPAGLTVDRHWIQERRYASAVAAEAAERDVPWDTCAREADPREYRCLVEAFPEAEVGEVQREVAHREWPLRPDAALPG